MMNNPLDTLDEFGLSAKTVDGRVRNWTDAEFDHFFEEYGNAARSRKLVEVAQRGSTDVFPDSVSGKYRLR